MKPAVLIPSFLGLVLTTMPGCIIRDLHDQMEGMDQTMRDTDQSVDALTVQLTETNRLIAELNRQIAEGSGQLREANSHLAAANERLAVLESIDASLKANELHLASLRRTLENVDDAVPVIDVTDPAADPASNPD